MIVSDEALGMGIASPSCERELMMGDVIESLPEGDDFRLTPDWRRNTPGSLAGGGYESLPSSACPTAGGTCAGGRGPQTRHVPHPRTSSSCGGTPPSATTSTAARSLIFRVTVLGLSGIRRQ